MLEADHILEDDCVVRVAFVRFSHVHTRIFFVVRVGATLPRRAVGTHVECGRFVVRHFAFDEGVAVAVVDRDILPVPVVGIGIRVRFAAVVIRPTVRLRDTRILRSLRIGVTSRAEHRQGRDHEDHTKELHGSLLIMVSLT